MITRVKICGITRVKDLEVALDAGAAAIGLNFFPGSPRYLAPRQAKKLLDAIPFMVEAVAVVVDMPPWKPKNSSISIPALPLSSGTDCLPRNLS